MITNRFVTYTNSNLLARFIFCYLHCQVIALHPHSQALHIENEATLTIFGESIGLSMQSICIV